MRNTIQTLVSLVLASLASVASAANDNAGILGAGGRITENKLRKGEISFDDIPVMISYATEFLLGFAATIAMIMIIYGAFQMSIMALTSDDKKKGVETAKNGIIGFAISVSAWLIVKVIISNL